MRRRLRWPAGSGDLRRPLAKATTIKVKLVSSADGGFYYVTRKNSGIMTDKLVTPPFCNLG
jgi:ribosomal protein L33